MTDAPYASPFSAPSLTAPPSAPASAPAASSITADQATSMATLTERMSTMGNNQFRQRTALAEAVHAEIAAGGTGAIALGKSPDAIRGEEIAKALEPTPDVQPGVHAPELYTATVPGLFGTIEERIAFGEAASAAGFDPQIVNGTLQSIRNDPAIARAVAAGDEAIDAHVAGVRDFFHRLPGGPERLHLGVAYLESLAAKNPLLGETVNAALMSADAISMAAWHAEQSGFKQPARR